MIIGIIAAMDVEFDIIKENLNNLVKENHANIDFFKGNMGNNEVVIAKSMVGKVNASITTSIMIAIYKPELIINSGIAGGGNGCKTRDVILADSLAYSDVDVQAFGYKFGTVPGLPYSFECDKEYKEKVIKVLNNLNIDFKSGVCLTADTFRLSAKEIKNELPSVFCCEMEGAAIAQACYRTNTKFLSIRFISDVLDSEDHIEDYNSFEVESANTSANITSLLIKNL